MSPSSPASISSLSFGTAGVVEEEVAGEEDEIPPSASATSSSASAPLSAGGSRRRRASRPRGRGGRARSASEPGSRRRRPGRTSPRACRRSGRSFERSDIARRSDHGDPERSQSHARSARSSKFGEVRAPVAEAHQTDLDHKVQTFGSHGHLRRLRCGDRPPRGPSRPGPRSRSACARSRSRRSRRRRVELDRPQPDVVELGTNGS